VTDESANSGKRVGFLGFVAHEVRNPLSTALWSAELLARMPAGERGGARGEKLSAMCLRSVSRVRQLIEDHFLCERLDAGGIPLRAEPIAPRELFEALLERAGERGELSIHVDPSHTVLGDRTLLERAIEAIVAVAGADGTAVRVEGREEGATVVLTISGKPPAPGALEDPAKGSPSDPRGRALALPLVRRIARALGGSLAAAGEAYLLSLPRTEAYSARPKPAAHP
jgi:K+-sensing histidine kinase KdpD